MLFNTPVLLAPLSGLRLWSLPILYCTVPMGTYYTVSLLFIFTGLCRQNLYEMYLNNEQYEHKSNKLGCEGILLFCTVVYLWVPSIMYSYGRYEYCDSSNSEPGVRLGCLYFLFLLIFLIILYYKLLHSYTIKHLT